ncbi:hypothetical protein L6452_44019 [Arctium lappa]|uniref:Uncharacterized protein n=1 Tax=Arctium lappa TaxID=4217 RepID=A0ACB8XII3_ARCLA|nr:hypothetical protein L6452_44019 [Arctium lappa]
MMNTPDPYYQKYGCKTWKPENSDTKWNNWQRKLDISSYEPAQHKKAQTQQELQAQCNFLEAYVRPYDDIPLGAKFFKNQCKWKSSDDWRDCGSCDNCTYKWQMGRTLWIVPKADHEQQLHEQRSKY